MTTFHPDFLRNHLGGIAWSPGLTYIPPRPGPCLLPNRTYYQIDSAYEPYLPPAPGTHGAKLTAFFNANPEDTFPDAQPDATTHHDVPLFVQSQDPRGRLRYTYFGHYSQARWSDRLDYDCMARRVAPHVKQYWAEELTAVGRPQWVTEKLMLHFWPKPEYEGRLFGFDAHGEDHDDEDLTDEQVGEREEKMVKDLRAHVKALRKWEREAKMKVGFIKKDFVLSAFERADADEPPALRLWWEYLECTHWSEQFYDTLVTLQSREAHYDK